MDRPVAAPLAIFARPVGRVDNPDSRLAEAHLGVGGFFGQQPVIGAVLRDRVAQEAVGGLVACVAQPAPGDQARRADGEQNPPGVVGQLRGEFGIIHRGPAISAA